MMLDSLRDVRTIQFSNTFILNFLCIEIEFKISLLLSHFELNAVAITAVHINIKYALCGTFVRNLKLKIFW